MGDHEGVDMTELADGHYRDTGNGPTLMPELPPPVGRGQDTPQRLAYGAYLDHAHTCAVCKSNLFGCEDGKRLWAAYKELHPLQEWVGRRDGSPTAPSGPA